MHQVIIPDATQGAREKTMGEKEFSDFNDFKSEARSRTKKEFRGWVASQDESDPNSVLSRIGKTVAGSIDTKLIDSFWSKARGVSSTTKVPSDVTAKFGTLARAPKKTKAEKKEESDKKKEEAAEQRDVAREERKANTEARREFRKWLKETEPDLEALLPPGYRLANWSGYQSKDGPVVNVADGNETIGIYLSEMKDGTAFEQPARGPAGVMAPVAPDQDIEPEPEVVGTPGTTTLGNFPSDVTSTGSGVTMVLPKKSKGAGQQVDVDSAAYTELEHLAANTVSDDGTVASFEQRFAEWNKGGRTSLTRFQAKEFFRRAKARIDNNKERASARQSAQGLRELSDLREQQAAERTAAEAQRLVTRESRPVEEVVRDLLEDGASQRLTHDEVEALQTAGVLTETQHNHLLKRFDPVAKESDEDMSKASYMEQIGIGLTETLLTPGSQTALRGRARKFLATSGAPVPSKGRAKDVRKATDEVSDTPVLKNGSLNDKAGSVVPGLKLLPDSGTDPMLGKAGIVEDLKTLVRGAYYAGEPDYEITPEEVMSWLKTGFLNKSDVEALKDDMRTVLNEKTGSPYVSGDGPVPPALAIQFIQDRNSEGKGGEKKSGAWRKIAANRRKLGKVVHSRYGDNLMRYVDELNDLSTEGPLGDMASVPGEGSQPGVGRAIAYPLQENNHPEVDTSGMSPDMDGLMEAYVKAYWTPDYELPRSLLTDFSFFMQRELPALWVTLDKEAFDEQARAAFKKISGPVNQAPEAVGYVHVEAARERSKKVRHHALNMKAAQVEADFNEGLQSNPGTMGLRVNLTGNDGKGAPRAHLNRVARAISVIRGMGGRAARLLNPEAIAGIEYLPMAGLMDPARLDALYEQIPKEHRIEGNLTQSLENYYGWITAGNNDPTPGFMEESNRIEERMVELHDALGVGRHSLYDTRKFLNRYIGVLASVGRGGNVDYRPGDVDTKVRAEDRPPTPVWLKPFLAYRASSLINTEGEATPYLGTVFVSDIKASGGTITDQGITYEDGTVADLWEALDNWVLSRFGEFDGDGKWHPFLTSGSREMVEADTAEIAIQAEINAGTALEREGVQPPERRTDAGTMHPLYRRLNSESLVADTLDPWVNGYDAVSPLYRNDWMNVKDYVDRRIGEISRRMGLEKLGIEVQSFSEAAGTGNAQGFVASSHPNMSIHPVIYLGERFSLEKNPFDIDQLMFHETVHIMNQIGVITDDERKKLIAHGDKLSRRRVLKEDWGDSIRVADEETTTVGGEFFIAGQYFRKGPLKKFADKAKRVYQAIAGAVGLRNPTAGDIYDRLLDGTLTDRYIRRQKWNNRTFHTGRRGQVPNETAIEKRVRQIQEKVTRSVGDRGSGFFRPGDVDSVTPSVVAYRIATDGFGDYNDYDGFIYNLFRNTQMLSKLEAGRLAQEAVRAGHSTPMFQAPPSWGGPMSHEDFGGMTEYVSSYFRDGGTDSPLLNGLRDRLMTVGKVLQSEFASEEELTDFSDSYSGRFPDGLESNIPVDASVLTNPYDPESKPPPPYMGGQQASRSVGHETPGGERKPPGSKRGRPVPGEEEQYMNFDRLDLDADTKRIVLEAIRKRNRSRINIKGRTWDTELDEAADMFERDGLSKILHPRWKSKLLNPTEALVARMAIKQMGKTVVALRNEVREQGIRAADELLSTEERLEAGAIRDSRIPRIEKIDADIGKLMDRFIPTRSRDGQRLALHRYTLDEGELDYAKYYARLKDIGYGHVSKKNNENLLRLIAEWNAETARPDNERNRVKMDDVLAEMAAMFHAARRPEYFSMFYRGGLLSQLNSVTYNVLSNSISFALRYSARPLVRAGDFMDEVFLDQTRQVFGTPFEVIWKGAMDKGTLRWNSEMDPNKWLEGQNVRVEKMGAYGQKLFRRMFDRFSNADLKHKAIETVMIPLHELFNSYGWTDEFYRHGATNLHLFSMSMGKAWAEETENAKQRAGIGGLRFGRSKWKPHFDEYAAFERGLAIYADPEGELEFGVGAVMKREAQLSGAPWIFAQENPAAKWAQKIQADLSSARDKAWDEGEVLKYIGTSTLRGVATVLAPFMRIPANSIAMAIYDYSPLGLASGALQKGATYGKVALAALKTRRTNEAKHIEAAIDKLNPKDLLRYNELIAHGLLATAMELMGWLLAEKGWLVPEQEWGDDEDLQNKAVGVQSGSFNFPGLDYSIPTNQLRPVVDSLLAGAKAFDDREKIRDEVILGMDRNPAESDFQEQQGAFEDAMDYAWSSSVNRLRNITDHPLLQAGNSVYEIAAGTRDTIGMRLQKEGAKHLAQVIPGFIASLSYAYDPTERQPIRDDDFWTALKTSIQNRLPLKKDLDPRSYGGVHPASRPEWTWIHSGMKHNGGSWVLDEMDDKRIFIPPVRKSVSNQEHEGVRNAMTTFETMLLHTLMEEELTRDHWYWSAPRAKQRMVLDKIKSKVTGTANKLLSHPRVGVMTGEEKVRYFLVDAMTEITRRKGLQYRPENFQRPASETLQPQ